MVNKIDKEDFRFIDVAFIQKTNLRHVSSIDIDGTNSLKHLQDIIESTKPMIKTLCLVHDDVEHAYRNVTNVMTNGKKVLEYHFVWARMILELYYFYHDTKDETLKIVEKMIALEGFEYVKEAVRAGIKLIDEYYEKEWDETIPDTHRTKNSQDFFASLRRETLEMFKDETNAPQQPKLNQNPDILQVMQDINSGKIRYHDVDWEFQLKHLLFLCSLMPKKFPDVLLIWGILGQLDDPAIKMDIIGKLQDAAPKCFADPFEANDFINDCSCLYRVYVKARAYYRRNDIGIRHTWSDDRKDLNDLAHIFCDEMVEPIWMVSMVEEMKRSETEDRRVPMLEIVLKANRNDGHMSVDNIVDFVKRLYIAEGFRQMILSGKEDYRDIPTLEKFDWRLRNGCFDIYIDLRKEQIKALLNRDNKRVEGADDFEALQYLFEKEKAIVEREKELDCLKGSPAYNALWYPGRKMVEDMITVFIQYLPRKIEKLRKAEAAMETGGGKETTSATMVFNGPVGQVIANVEHMHNKE